MEPFDIVCDFEDFGIRKGGPQGEDMVMYGWASSPSRDADHERILQEGLDCSALLSKGWINWNHQQHEIIGVPLVADVREREGFGKGLYTEFKLLPKVPMAQHVWNLAKSLEEIKADRRLGLSIEGHKLESDKGVVRKASVVNIAVCPNPKNTDATVSALVKAIVDDDVAAMGQFRPVEPIAQFAVQISDGIVAGLRKAIDSGYTVGGTDQAGGAAVRREDVERGADAVPFNVGGNGDLYKHLDPETRGACEALSKIATSRDGSLTKAEAALFVHLTTSKPLNECFKVFGIRTREE